MPVYLRLQVQPVADPPEAGESAVIGAGGYEPVEPDERQPDAGRQTHQSEVPPAGRAQHHAHSGLKPGHAPLQFVLPQELLLGV